METLEGKTIKPHLNIINQNSELNMAENECFRILYLLNKFWYNKSLLKKVMIILEKI